MNDRNLETDPFETWVAEHARRFRYPAAPAPRPIPLAVYRRRQNRRAVMVWAAVLLVVLMGAFSAPSVRAAVVEFFQVGVTRIFFGESGIQPESRLPLLQELSGRTSLAEAGEVTGIPVRYPEALGEPDEVYFQTIEGPLLLMVWFDGDEVAATLLALGPGAFAGKGATHALQETAVDGRPAVWLEGDHPLYLRTADGGFAYVTLFEAGDVLLWEFGEITYRLEGFSDMETALRIAETLTGTP